MKKRSLLLAVAFVSLAIGGVVISVRQADEIAKTKPRSIETQLAAFSGNESIGSFLWPNGEMHRFLIARPQTFSEDFTSIRYNGKIEIETPSGIIYSHSFTKATLTNCNWMDRHGLDSWIIHMESWKELNAVPPGTQCTFRITFEEPIPSRHSLWISRVTTSGSA